MFTQLLNDASRPDHVPGARVVAAFKGGSPDVEASATRIEKFTAELRDKWKIELVDSIDELLRRVDAVMLTSVDGRVHLAQARPVLAARKPVFVDKPLAASVRDAHELARLAREHKTPVFSSSSLRFSDDVQAIKKDPRVSRVHGAMAWGPGTLEPHHPDLFWYGIHAVEVLYTFMGAGCERVTRTHSPGGDLVILPVERRANGRGPRHSRRIGALRPGRVRTQGVVVSCRPRRYRRRRPKRSSYYGLVSAASSSSRPERLPSLSTRPSRSWRSWKRRI